MIMTKSRKIHRMTGYPNPSPMKRKGGKIQRFRAFPSQKDRKKLNEGGFFDKLTDVGQFMLADLPLRSLNFNVFDESDYRTDYAKDLYDERVDTWEPVVQTANQIVGFGLGGAAGAGVVEGVQQAGHELTAEDPNAALKQQQAYEQMKQRQATQMGMQPYEQMGDRQTTDMRIDPHSYSPAQARYGGKISKLKQGGKFSKYQNKMKKLNLGGQFEEHRGQTHQGPDEGIEINEQGSPVAQAGGQGIALTEDGEVRWNDYVFSNELKLPGNKKRTFADEAKRVKSKYKKRLGEDLDKHDPISQDAMEEELDELMMIQESIKGKTIHQDDAEQMMQEQAMQMEQSMMQQDPGAQQGAPMEGGMPMEQMPPEMMGEQPMMRRGGKLPKYRDGIYRFGMPTGFGIPTEEEMIEHQLQQPRPTSPGYSTTAQSVRPRQFTQPGQPTLGAEFTPDPRITQPYTRTGINRRTEGEMMRSPAGQQAGVSAGTQTGGGVESEQVPISGGYNWLGPALSAAGTVAGYFAGKDKSEPIRMPRIAPQTLNVEPAKTAVRQQGREATSTHQAMLAQAGTTSAGYQRAARDVALGVQGQTGQQLSNIGMQKAQFDAQQRGETDRINMQMAAQERMDRQRRRDMERQRKEHLYSSLGNIGTHAMRDRQQIQMMEAQAQLQQPEHYPVMNQQNWWERFTGSYPELDTKYRRKR